MIATTYLLPFYYGYQLGDKFNIIIIIIFLNLEI